MVAPGAPIVSANSGTQCGTVGACTLNRPCAQQYVGKSQSCMVISGRLMVHAPVDLQGTSMATPLVAGTAALARQYFVEGKGTMRVELIGHFKPCMTDNYLHI